MQCIIISESNFT